MAEPNPSTVPEEQLPDINSLLAALTSDPVTSIKALIKHTESDPGTGDYSEEDVQAALDFMKAHMVVPEDKKEEVAKAVEETKAKYALERQRIKAGSQQIVGYVLGNLVQY